MSYICTGSVASTAPVICHCQLVPGLGCQILDWSTVDELVFAVGLVAQALSAMKAMAAMATRDGLRLMAWAG